MRKRNEWNTDGLQRHAEKLRGETETKVNDSIDEMKRKHKVINFKTVAEASGVSRATLYENEKLRRRIESLRAVKTTKASDPGVEHQRRTQEKDLRRQIKVLKEEKEMLISQLVEMDRVMQENQHLKKLLASKKRE